MEGDIERKSDYLKKWKKAHGRIDTHFYVFETSAKDSKVTAIVPLIKCTVSQTRLVDADFCVEIRDSKRPFYFKLRNQEEVTKWVNAVQQQISKNKIDLPPDVPDSSNSRSSSFLEKLSSSRTSVSDKTERPADTKSPTSSITSTKTSTNGVITNTSSTSTSSLPPLVQKGNSSTATPSPPLSPNSQRKSTPTALSPIKLSREASANRHVRFGEINIATITDNPPPILSPPPAAAAASSPPPAASSSSLPASPPPVVPLLKSRSSDKLELSPSSQNMNSPGGSFGSKSYFGLSLLKLAEKEKGRKLPEFVEKAIAAIEKNLNEEGIFRVSGTTDKVNKIKESYNTGQTVDFSTIDIHSVAGALKLFYREIPDLLTKDQKVKIDAIVDIEDNRPKQVEEFIELFKTFNPYTMDTLQALISINVLIAKNQTVTKMTSLNLATVWNQTLKCNAEFLLILIDHYEDIFLKQNSAATTSIDTGAPPEKLPESTTEQAQIASNE